MKTYYANEDLPLSVEVESDDPEKAYEQADDRLKWAWRIMNAALEAEDIGVYLGNRYDDDLSVWDEGECVAGNCG